MNFQKIFMRICKNFRKNEKIRSPKKRPKNFKRSSDELKARALKSPKKRKLAKLKEKAQGFWIFQIYKRFLRILLYTVK